jgi:hypothetical protein
MNLARIRNPHAIVRLLRQAAPATKPRVWGPLAAPVDPLETQLRARAQSILSGPLIGQCPPLSIEQARDVVAWYRPKS